MSEKSILYITMFASLSAGAGLPGSIPSVYGEAAGGFRSPEERSDSRVGETHSPQGGRQDAAHLRQGHSRWDR